MGIDSLSMVRVKAVIKDRYEVNIPVSILFQETTNLDNLAKMIDELKLTSKEISGL
jgi:hypothetical protein